MAKMASLHAAENENPDVPRETINYTPYTLGFKAGQDYERKRVLEMLKHYWCGEADCTKHTTNWPHLIESLKNAPVIVDEPDKSCGNPCKCDNESCENGY